MPRRCSSLPSGQPEVACASICFPPGSALRQRQQVLSSARVTHRVGWGFISLYSVAFMSTSLLFLAPLLVTLALKVDSIAGLGRAPASIAGRKKSR